MSVRLGRVKHNSVSLLTDLSKVFPLWMSTDECQLMKNDHYVGTNLSIHDGILQKSGNEPHLDYDQRAYIPPRTSIYSVL